MKIIIIFITILLLLNTSVFAEIPEPVIKNRRFVNIFDYIFNLQSITGGGFVGNVDSVSKGQLITASPYVKFYHDSESSIYVTYFENGITGQRIEASRIQDNYPFNEQDKIAITISNLDTNKIPDSWCNLYVTLYIEQYNCYDNECALETPKEGGFSQYFLFDCGGTCDRKYTGYADDGSVLGNFCKSGDVYNRYQTKDCRIFETNKEDCLGDGCSNAECGKPIVCNIGDIGNEFCNNNRIYQKVGLGAINGACDYQDNLIESCSDDESCTKGNCVTNEFCGDGSCNNGETPVTCSIDCGAPISCGDNICNGDESSITCSQDCFEIGPEATEPSNQPANQPAKNYTTYLWWIFGVVGALIIGIIIYGITGK